MTCSWAANVAGMEQPVESSTDTTTPDDTPMIEDELLVEEISIDGMCGVY